MVEGRLGQVSGGDETFKANIQGEVNPYPKVLRSDLMPREFDEEETLIALQRHGKYSRDGESVGSLTEEAVREEANAARKYFEGQLELIPEEERKDVSFLFVASDTSYGEGQRSMETGNIVLETLKQVLAENGLGEEQILNNSDRIKGGEGVRPTQHLREPLFFEETPEYFQFMKEKYSGGSDELGPDFWAAVEGDLEAEVRKEMGAEGPDDMADRMQKVVKLFKRFASIYHHNNPNKRLIIWAASHYDTISVLVKRDLYNAPHSQFVGVENGGGINIKVDKDGNSDTIISGNKYNI